MALPISRASYSLLSVRDTCARLAVGRSSLYQFVRRGWLTPIRYGRSVRFDPLEIDGFIASRRGKKAGEA